MSKTQDKRFERKQEQAEFLWQRAQLNAAMAKNQLDASVHLFKELNKEMTTEQIQQTEEQAKLQYDKIEKFLMSEKEAYLARMGIQQD